MGITGSGKSSFIKEVTGQDVPVGSGIYSTTTQVKIYRATVDGREVLFVDTPGFDDSKKNEGEILHNITGELARLYSSDIPISGVIYIHDITAEKLTGTAQRYLNMFEKIVGPNALRNVTLLTTKWDRMPQDYNENKEKMLKDGPWKKLIRHGASVRSIGLTYGRAAYETIVKELLRNVAATLQIQQELVDQQLPLNETTAGRMLDEQIREATEDLRKKLDEVDQELAAAKAQHGRGIEELRQSLEEDKEDLRRELRQSEQGRNALQQQFEGLQIKEESRAQQLQQTIDALRQQQQPSPPPQPIYQPAPQTQVPCHQPDRSAEYQNLSNQASAFFEQSLMQQAQQLFTQAYNLALYAFGPHDWRTNEARHNVGAMQTYVGSYIDKGPGGLYYSAGGEGASNNYDNDDYDSDDSYY